MYNSILSLYMITESSHILKVKNKIVTYAKAPSISLLFASHSNGKGLQKSSMKFMLEFRQTFK